MKVLIQMPIWKRKEITKIAFKGVKRLMENLPYKFQVLCVVSENWAIKECKKNGFDYIFCDNYPQGMKLNKGLSKALKYDFDYMLRIGSDNLISEKLFDSYKYYIDKGFDLMGIDKVYFLNGTKAKRVDYDGQMSGVGRLISKKALIKAARKVYIECIKGFASHLYTLNKGEKIFMHLDKAKEYEKIGYIKIIGAEVFKLWDDKKFNCLDANSNFNLITSGAKNVIIDIGKEPFVVDMKSDVNIWKYDDIPGEDVKREYAIKEMPEL